MTTTMADMVADARRMTHGSMSSQINILAANAAASAESLTFELDTSGITPGMILSSKLNVWYVKGVVPADKQVLVIPGFDNAPQSAASIDDIVYIKPRVTEWYLFNTLNDVIRSMSSPLNGLYKEGTFSLSVDPTYQTYEIPVAAQNMVGISRIRIKWLGTVDTWSDLAPFMYQWQPSLNLIKITRNLPAGSTIEVVYKAPFTVAAALSDSVTTVCGLSDSMVDIPPLGAVVTLLRTTEGRRTQVTTQGDARRADEVPTTANLSAAAAFERDYKSRIQDEYIRLIQRTPVFKGV